MKLSFATAAIAAFCVGCGFDKDVEGVIDKKATYSLCPKTSTARDDLINAARSFAKNHGARYVDRSSEARNELLNMRDGRATLEKSGGILTLITIELPKSYRISLSNLGLAKKTALTVRLWDDRARDQSDIFLRNLNSSWSIREEEVSVADDPPC